MSSSPSSPSPPPSSTISPIVFHKLDKESFHQQINLLALRVPVQACSLYLKKFASELFQRPRMKRIFEIKDNKKMKLLLINENIQKYDEISLNLRHFHEEEIQKFMQKEENFDNELYEIYSFSLTYNDLSVDEILKKLFNGILKEIPSAYEQAGHIAHLNIRDEALPYKFTIGQVILDKNPSIKTVVNKIGNIETEFRTFPLELIAGEENYIATVKESGASLSFDFSKVYWNSRLQTEHLRMIHLIRQSAIDAAKKSERYPDGQVIVADMTAGVGPFAVPLGMITGNILANEFVEYAKNFNLNQNGDHEAPLKKKKISYPTVPILIHANDLNPCSYDYLNQNIIANGCQSSVISYNLCAREFIKKLVGEKLVMPHECIINLPQNSIDFIDCFKGIKNRYIDAVKKNNIPGSKWSTHLPRLNIYSFTRELDDPLTDLINRCAEVLECKPEDIRSSNAVVHNVRDVSPKKIMACITFDLPLCVAEKSY